MNRSRRAMNPQNYNDDGTIKKGHKTWKYSNHYKRLKAKHAELCRINAINRQLAIYEDASHLRSLGDVFIIKNRCPSGFQVTVANKFNVSGGTYIEVPNDYRASQYDHTANNYIKKKLSDRF